MAANARPTRREQREQRREEERRRREAAAAKARTQKYLIYGVIAVLVIVGSLLAVGPLTGAFSSGGSAQGTQFANQGQDHINPGQQHAAYNSNPPTSGPHYPDPARWGIYDQPLPDETLVHNLEHGGIVIGYNCPDGCPDLVNQLKQLAGEYKSKLVLAPRSDRAQPSRITLTAWRWLDGFNDFDEARIRAFITAHKDKGPELLPD